MTVPPPVPGQVPAPAAGAAPAAPAPPAAGYDHWTREPVVYFEVLFRGRPIGHLWASGEHPAAGFLCAPDASEEVLEAAEVWEDRLAEAYGRGESAVDAVRRWRGAPDDPRCGAVPGDARERGAPSLSALYELTEPGVPAPAGPLAQDGRFHDGTPVDRELGQGPAFSVVSATYPGSAEGPVRYLTVVRRSTVLGYVWAAEDGRSAGYVPRAAAGRAGETAAGWWRLWLSRAFQARLPALDAMRRCGSVPADETAGYIGPAAEERALPDLDALRDLARA
ncbi:hypothetical protein [Spirillospora sp. NPDC029432]|uniref:hypothetical protein n=1 Tax=Spirillospora sp. NPDC029432 TaxID=3154599 RepID=UPI003454C7DC